MNKKASVKTLRIISMVILISCAVMAATLLVLSSGGYAVQPSDPDNSEYTAPTDHIDENTAAESDEPTPEKTDPADNNQAVTVGQNGEDGTDDEQTPPITTPTEGEMATVKAFLSSALEPIGHCLYVYGGGWNEEDTGAGDEAMTVGMSRRWKEFYDENDSTYNHKNSLYRVHDGLDCTGYVGYAAYQVFGDKYSQSGYVFPSGKVGQEYKKLFGGTLIGKESIDKHRAGDIMVKKGHVYISLGECSDGSVLIAHASPPNVTLSGTCTPTGNKNSEALALAEKYMKKIAPDAYGRYSSNCSRGMSYLTDYDLYRFPDEVLSDPDGYREMSVDDMMNDLTKDR